MLTFFYDPNLILIKLHLSSVFRWNFKTYLRIDLYMEKEEIISATGNRTHNRHIYNQVRTVT